MSTALLQVLLAKHEPVMNETEDEETIDRTNTDNYDLLQRFVLIKSLVFDFGILLTHANIKYTWFYILR